MLISTLARLYRILPIMGGQTRLSRNAVVNRLVARASGKPVQAVLWDGSRMDVDLSDHDGRILYLFGTNDIKVARNTRVFLREGDVFLDIGANHGSIGLYAAAAVGATGEVHLFEPQKKLAERIRTAISGRGYQNVHLHRCGLLDVNAKLTIRMPSNHSGRASFAAQSEEFSASEDCDVYEIGPYVAPLLRGRPFGVKLDIEGAEPRVLPWLLAQTNLVFLIVEANQNSRTLFDLVSAAGLRLFGLERRLLQLRLGRIDAFDDMAHYHDVIALRLRADADPPRSGHPQSLLPHLARD